MQIDQIKDFRVPDVSALEEMIGYIGIINLTKFLGNYVKENTKQEVYQGNARWHQVYNALKQYISARNQELSDIT